MRMIGLFPGYDRFARPALAGPGVFPGPVTVPSSRLPSTSGASAGPCPVAVRFIPIPTPNGDFLEPLR